MIRQLTIQTPGQGLHLVTDQIEAMVREAGIREGLCTIMVRHTSASLMIQENADPSARRDLERWFDHLVTEGDPLYTHTAEGPDDMPAHIKAALTATTLSVPVIDGRLALGTWQGIFLYEHRNAPHTRRLALHLLGE